MPIMPIRIAGALQLVTLPAGAGAQDQERAAEENARRVEVMKRRLYVDGRQYAEENAETQAAECKGDTTKRLPEHMRLHAYSTQLNDAIEFVTGELAGSFRFAAADATVQTILEDAFRASDQFSGENEDDEITIELVLRDCLLAGDVACEVKWDPIDGTSFVEVWESEQVEFVMATRRRLEAVVRTEVRWVTNDRGEDQEVVEKIRYEMAVNEFGEFDCLRLTFWDDEEEPREQEWLRLPFIPWVLVKGRRKGLRTVRGESLVTDQAMEHADRYNANEQTAYLIARYNSHGNLAVVGDAAHLEIDQSGYVHKDVADVLSFPGGTNVMAISLPTDTQMIEHQRAVLAEAMYNAFGLTRVEPGTIEGLGGISGYALEILNRKTEGTFRKIRQTFSSGFRSLCAMILDVHAYRNAEVAPSRDLLNEFDVDVEQFWTVDPAAEYPNREIEVRLGSGFVVNDVMVRDDFTAGLISRRNALEQRGMEPDEIDQIEKEIEDETPETEALTPFRTGGIGGGSLREVTAGG